MKLKFGLLVSRPQTDIIYEVLPELETYCDVTIFIMEDWQQAYETYKANWPIFDAFIFGGQVAMMGVKARMGSFPKPYFCFEDIMGNLCEMLFAMLLNDRNFDFSRTFVDFASESNNYLGLKEILPKDQWPYFAEDDSYRFSLTLNDGNADEMTRKAYERHLHLHQSGAVDLSITRYGVIMDKILRLGYACVYTNISREYIVNFFMQVVSTMSQAQTSVQALGCAIVSLEAARGEKNALMADLSKSLMQYAGSHGFEFSLSRERSSISIVTSYDDLDKITNGFTNTSELTAISPKGDTILWGLGTGTSIFQARRNAAHAIDVSMQHRNGIYYVSEDGNVVGPMGDNQSIYHISPSSALFSLSNKFKVDHVKLQKIVAFTKLNKSSVVTAEEVASLLQVTPRTANRLLNKITEQGGASVYQQTGSGRGRPTKHYALTFVADLPQNG